VTETFPVTLLVELSPVTIPTFRSQSQLSGHCSPVTFPTFHFGPNPHQNFVPDFVSVTPFWAWWLLPVVVFGFSWPPLPAPPPLAPWAPWPPGPLSPASAPEPPPKPPRPPNHQVSGPESPKPPPDPEAPRPQDLFQELSSQVTFPVILNSWHRILLLGSAALAVRPRQYTYLYIYIYICIYTYIHIYIYIYMCAFM
jgi:hypothetical protein